MHRGGSKVKSYYSSGSLSFVTPELWSFFAMYGELMSHPAYVDPIPPPTPPPVGSNLEAATAFGPHHWFSEHAATALFSSDWTTPLSHPTNSPICDGCDMDVSFTTRANSRLANFWSRLLVLATDELDIDGIYLGQSSSLFSSLLVVFGHIARPYPSPQSNTRIAAYENFLTRDSFRFRFCFVCAYLQTGWRMMRIRCSAQHVPSPPVVGFPRSREVTWTCTAGTAGLPVVVRLTCLSTRSTCLLWTRSCSGRGSMTAATWHAAIGSPERVVMPRGCCSPRRACRLVCSMTC